ncbi:hypothetical protein [Photorhabdus khanii]|nr:hypothetical protein [Photorhabdus khanii]
MIKEMDFDFKPKNKIKEKRENPSINLMNVGTFKYKAGSRKTIFFTKIVQ